MTAADVEAVHLVSGAAFGALETPTGTPGLGPSPFERARLRIERLMATDPGGCWVGEHDGRVAGAAIALIRDGLWGLSLLVVDPEHQSAGMGRELLAHAAAYGEAARGHIILSSADPRAVSAYLSLGFDLRPAAGAAGVPRSVEGSGEARPGGSADAELIAEVDRQVRGAPHGGDIDVLMAAGHRLLVLPGRGYVMQGPDAISLLAARDEEAAAELLRSALAGAGDAPIRVDWLTADQQWAVDVCRTAGLRFQLGWGAILTAGEVGPLRPYLPNGAYI